VGGVDAVLVDSKHSVGRRLPLAVALVGLTTFLLLFLFTGRVVQPLRALLLNMISLGATLGVMTWIFQDGRLSSLLGFTAQPTDVSMTGLGSGLAILIDAVAVRGVLVPAAMRLLGRSAWYAPGFPRRFPARFGLSEGGSAPEAAPGPLVRGASEVH